MIYSPFVRFLKPPGDEKKKKNRASNLISRKSIHGTQATRAAFQSRRHLAVELGSIWNNNSLALLVMLELFISQRARWNTKKSYEIVDFYKNQVKSMDRVSFYFIGMGYRTKSAILLTLELK